MLSIGVTGHRKLIEEEQIRLGVDQALNRIQESFSESKMTIFSPLAEGADRLVASRAMAICNAELAVPLPLEVSDYIQDFSNPSSRAEFESLLFKAAQVIELPPQADREASYLAAGLYVLTNSDVLIAIWDGKPPRGPGGTGQIVALARERQQPIAWIFAGSRELDNLPSTRCGDKPGEVRYENFP